MEENSEADIFLSTTITQAFRGECLRETGRLFLQVMLSNCGNDSRISARKANPVGYARLLYFQKAGRFFIGATTV